MKQIDIPCPISTIGYLNPFGHETLLRARGVNVPSAAVLQSMRSGLGCVPEAGVPVVLASDAAAGWAQAKHLPGQAFKKAVSKSAPIFYGTLKEIVSDPGYGHISETLRSKLDDLLAQIKAVEDAAEAQQGVESSSEAENEAPAV